MHPRIVFAGTPDFAAQHLSALLNTDYQPIAVYTQPDRPAGRGRNPQASAVKQVAVQAGIDCYQPESLKLPEQQQTLAQLQPDLMIVVAYGLILPQAVLNIPTKGCINVHASLLPRWRGAAPIQRAIEAGDTHTGVTIMQMDAGLDTGAMLHKRATDIHSDDTSASLHDRLAGIGASALLEILPKIFSGEAKAEQQNEALANYAHKLNKQDGLIDWHLPAIKIDQKIRAYTPWPGAQTNLQGTRIKIQARLFDNNQSNAEPGEIMQHTKQGLIVACGVGHLLVEQIQLPGKRMTPAAALINSQPTTLAIGCRFN